MEMNKKPWPLTTLCGIKNKIDTNPDYQRPAVWSKAQKQLLLDTILRGYDIPKFYWRKTGSNPDTYEVVDGQQRIRAIWEFQENGFPLAKNADPINGESIAGLYYSDLPDDLRIHFDTYTLDIAVITEADDEEVREMFLRLQNGTTLKAQEKRNAMPGAMRDFVRQLSSHQFFENCYFNNARYTYDHVAAQMVLIELEGEPTNVKDADLNRMYKSLRDFDIKCGKANKVKRVLDYLSRMFPEKTPELERYNAVSLYTLISYLHENFVIQDRASEIADWFINFESYRREQRKLPVDECDNEIVTYFEKTSHSTDAKDSLQWRHDYLMRKLFEAVPDIEPKDEQRIFSHEQRLAIYRRDKGVCQLKLRCDGAKCEWDHWEADHISPWSKGGKTTVLNGQVACISCNASKGAII